MTITPGMTVRRIGDGECFYVIARVGKLVISIVSSGFRVTHVAAEDFQPVSAIAVLTEGRIQFVEGNESPNLPRGTR